MKREEAFGTIGLLLLFVAVSFFVSLSGQDAGIECFNTSRYLGSGQWEFRIFIRASDDILRGVDRVEYILPISFREPAHQINQRGDLKEPFLLIYRASGRFPIGVRIMFSNGQMEEIPKYDIRIDERRVEVPYQIKIKHEVWPHGENQWEWSAYLRATPAVLSQIELVKYSIPSMGLGSEFSYEVLDQGGARAFNISGYCSMNFSLQIRIYFKDGRYQDLPLQNISILGTDDKGLIGKPV